MKIAEAVRRWLSRYNTAIGPTNSNYDIELDMYLLEASPDEFVSFLRELGEHKLLPNSIELLGAGAIESFINVNENHLAELENLALECDTILSALKCSYADEDSPEAAVRLLQRCENY